MSDNRNQNRYKDKYQDKYTDNYRENHKDRYKDNHRDKHRDDSYDNTDRSRSREKCKERKVGYNSKGEHFYKVIKQLDEYKAIALQLILANSTNFHEMFYSIHSVADVDHLIAERIAYIQKQKAINLTDKISSSMNTPNSVNCVSQEPIKVDSCTREQPRTYVQEEMKYQSIEHYSICE